MLALEMGYFRTSAPETQIATSEHDWLFFLEQQLANFLEKNITGKSKALHIYMEAFKKVFHTQMHFLLIN
jgi:hypothetical protein